jgi:hypothetical protein
MGELHQIELQIGRLSVAIVYWPKEWQWCIEDCTELHPVLWWVKAGPVALMWFTGEGSHE